MYDILVLRTFLSLAVRRPWEEVKIYGPYWPSANEIFSEIQAAPNYIHFLITHDTGPRGLHTELENLLKKDSNRYKIFVTHTDFIVPSHYVLDNIIRLPWCHNVMSNIDSLSQAKALISDTFTANDLGPWLSLNRRPGMNTRQYLKTQWLEPNDQYFLYTFGEEKFAGDDYNFYNKTYDKGHGNKTPNPPNICNMLNFMSLENLYNQTCGSVVTESLGGTSITEKTIHAFLALHPIIMIGHPGTVQYLRTQGFDMFDDLIDHSYDTIIEYKERTDSAMEKNWKIIEQGINRKDIQDRLLKNRKNVWNYYDNSLNNMLQIIRKNL